MFFHIGKREVISLDTVIGIFNAETIELSEFNEDYIDEMKESTRSVIIDQDDEVITSEIASITLIEREVISADEYLWNRRS